jgi:hypothetical protein
LSYPIKNPYQAFFEKKIGALLNFVSVNFGRSLILPDLLFGRNLEAVPVSEAEGAV